MKETNLKPLKPLLPLYQIAERKLNNIVFCLHKKAGLAACLFLCAVLTTSVKAQEWKFDAATQRAYDLVLNLQTEEAHALIPTPETPQEHYILALAEALELLITEDVEKFSDYEDRFEKRQERKSKLSSPEDLFLQAEIGLQWSFIYLKYGHEFDAALNLRQAYQTTQEIKKRFPTFNAIKKTSGLLDIIIGSVPEKYDWVLGLLNMEGSTELGLKELSAIQDTDHALAFESSLLYALTQGFVLEQTSLALTEIKKDIAANPTNKLALFLGASLAIKNSQSEEALRFINKLSEQSQGLPLYYADYLRGEIYLHKGEYLNATSSYRAFIGNYKGVNYMKDANYKIGLCYWLNGNSSDAKAIFKQAKTIGKESAEADKYAARSMAENELPHIKLTKARYSTDGGYYDEAKKVLASITTQELPTKRDQVEFAYRKARVAHKTNDLSTAKEYYLQTIKINGEEPWYFAPNASLQLGYIALAEKNTTQARDYFKRALGYKKHEYKNSIDSKAKSALAQLNESK
jgi:TolA-binding protein